MNFGTEIPKHARGISGLLIILAWMGYIPSAHSQCPNNPVLTPDTWGGASGGYSSSAGVYTLHGDGDYYDTQDYEQGEAAYRVLVGNGQIQARISSLAGSKGSDTGVGIYIRRGTSAGNDGAFLWLRGPSSSKVVFADRTSGGNLMIQRTGSSSIPSYLRLQNWNGIVYPAVSSNGVSWVDLNAYDLTADLGAGQTLTYGLMVWSGVNGSPTTATFGNVCVSVLTTPIPTYTPTQMASPTVTPTSTRTPSRTPTPTPTASTAPTSLFSATSTPSATPTRTITATATPPTGVGVWPNPFTPDLSTDRQAVFPLPLSHGAGQLLVIDLHRRSIRSIQFGAGAIVAWDGKNESGGTVPSGVYIYLLEADGTVKRGTVTVLR